MVHVWSLDGLRVSPYAWKRVLRSVYPAWFGSGNHCHSLIWTWAWRMMRHFPLSARGTYRFRPRIHEIVVHAPTVVNKACILALKGEYFSALPPPKLS